MRLIGATLQNYKSFTSSQELIGLKTANALIGPNNEGKSTFLEALRFPRYMSSFIVDGNPEGSRRHMLDRAPGKILGPPPEVELRFDLEERDIPAAWQQGSRPMLSYTIKWAGPPDEAPTMFFETAQITLSSPEVNEPIPLLFPSENDLTYCGAQLSQVIESWRHGKREQISREDVRNRGRDPYSSMDDGPGHGVLASLRDWAERLVYVPSHRVIRVHGDTNADTGPIDGVTLPARLRRMRTNNYDAFEDFERQVKRMIPTVRAVLTHEEEDQRISIRVSLQEGTTLSDDAFRLDQVGGGVNEVLYLIAAVWLSDPGSVCLVEEPERGLHPSSQRLFLKAALEHAKGQQKQLFWTTHSTVMAPMWDDFSVHLVTTDDSDRSTVTVIDREESERVLTSLGSRFLDLYDYDITVLCDGDTEVAALPRILRHYLTQESSSGVRFQSLYGDITSKKELIRQILSLLRHRKNGILILADADARADQTKDDLLKEYGYLSDKQIHIWDCGVSENGGSQRRAEFEDNFSHAELIEAGNQLAGGDQLIVAEFDRRIAKAPAVGISKALTHYYYDVYTEEPSKPELGDLLGRSALLKIQANTSRGAGGTSYEFEAIFSELAEWIP